MSDNNSLCRLEVVQERVDELGDRAAAGCPQFEEMSPALFQQLVTTLEELQVAEEKLRNQAEALTSARHALEAERQCYEDLSDFATDGCVVTDASGTIREVNRAAATLLSKPQKCLVGKPLGLFVAKEDRQAFHAQLTRLQHEGVERVQAWELQMEPHEGAAFHAALAGAPVRDAKGRLIGLRWLLRAVTGREHEDVLRNAVEESRRRSAESLALLEGARTILEYRDFDGTARAIFDSCKNLIGATGGYIALLTEDGSENEVLFLDSGGLPCTVDPSLPMPIRGLRQEAYITRSAVYENDFARSEWVKYLPEEHVGLDAVLFAPLVIEGKAVGLLGLANKPGGFTERDARMASAFGDLAAIALHNSRTLESLAQSEARFRSVVEAAGDAIIVIDSRGHVVFWNRAAEAMFGYPASEVIGQPLTIVMPERFREAHQKKMQRVASMGKSPLFGQVVEVMGLRKDGSEFPLELSLAAWKAGKGTFFTGTIRDITERRRAEELLREAYHNLERRVEQRTVQLSKANASLKAEIAERARVEQALRRRTEELAALHADSLDIIGSHDLPALLNIIVQRAARLLNAAAGALFRSDPDREEVHCMVSYPTSHDCTEIMLKAGEGAAVTVIQTGKSLIIHDCCTWPGQAAVSSEERLATVLSVPLILQDQVIGAISLIDDAKARRFTQADAELLTMFADQASIAIENARLLDAERAQREVAETLRETTGVLGSSLDRDDVLRHILEQLARVVDYDSASIMLVSDETLMPVAYRGSRFEIRQVSPLRIDDLKHVQEVLERRVAVIIPDTTVDSRWLRLGGGEYSRCWMGVPLVVQGRAVGMLNLGKRQPGFYIRRHATLAMAFAHQAAIAIENARLFEQTRASQARLQTLSQQLVEAMEAERRSIARELHDQIGQTLTGLKFTLERGMLSAVDRTAASLAEAQALVDELTGRISELSFDLRPTTLDDLGLLPALVHHFKRYTAQTNVQVTFKCSDIERRFRPEIETTAYRVVQEALTNVARHAGVSEVAVRLWAEQDTLTAQIEDHGVGFDLAATQSTFAPSGLVGMHERAALLGGQLTVESAPGAGTCVTAKLPLSGNRSKRARG